MLKRWQNDLATAVSLLNVPFLPSCPPQQRRIYRARTARGQLGRFCLLEPAGKHSSTSSSSWGLLKGWIWTSLRKRRGGRVAKIVFPMSGTSFLLNTVDFGNSSSIIPCLAWPTFVSKFNHIAPCFAFFFCTHISNSFLMTSRQQPNKEYQPRRLYIHCLLSFTLWATLQDFELLKQVPESSHPTSSFGRNQHIGTLILS